MNRSKNLRLWLVLAVALLLAAGLGWMRFSTPPAPPGNLAGASLGGPFTLTNQDGQTVRDTDFAGRWRLIYFGYGFCPDVCPTDLALVGRGLQEFEAQEAGRAANVAPIFITIDPERDTPAVARREPYRCPTFSIGAVAAGVDLTKASQLAAALEDEALIERLRQGR